MLAAYERRDRQQAGSYRAKAFRALRIARLVGGPLVVEASLLATIARRSPRMLAACTSPDRQQAGSYRARAFRAQRLARMVGGPLFVGPSLLAIIARRSPGCSLPVRVLIASKLAPTERGRSGR
ncbi:hypothetical protein C1896_18230 [Pseudomonadaceae bacterium SI-3]|nr:hypothetical protein C1896_18230 [Pseudomonadaceae bacterium SI-3]